MNTIETRPPSPGSATSARQLPQPPALPELKPIERLTLRICLALITRIEQNASRDHATRLHENTVAREEREHAAERLRRLSPPLR